MSIEQAFAKKQRDYYESFVSSDKTCVGKIQKERY